MPDEKPDSRDCTDIKCIKDDVIGLMSGLLK